MAEKRWHWTFRGVRYCLLIRWWFRNPFSVLRRWLMGGFWWGDEPEITLRTNHGSSECYCPEGLETNFRLQFAGAGCCGWYSRDWTARPCPCDEALEALGLEATK